MGSGCGSFRISSGPSFRSWKQRCAKVRRCICKPQSPDATKQLHFHLKNATEKTQSRPTPTRDQSIKRNPQSRPRARGGRGASTRASGASTQLAVLSVGLSEQAMPRPASPWEEIESTSIPISTSKRARPGQSTHVHLNLPILCLLLPKLIAHHPQIIASGKLVGVGGIGEPGEVGFGGSLVLAVCDPRAPSNPIASADQSVDSLMIASSSSCGTCEPVASAYETLSYPAQRPSGQLHPLALPPLDITWVNLLTVS